ncbi:hypothetical protein FRC17_009077 [Serendipita sp. 399]|nr:hypothetical protein FRC17_009077 [Serendipita sp. 399]
MSRNPSHDWARVAHDLSLGLIARNLHLDMIEFMKALNRLRPDGESPTTGLPGGTGAQFRADIRQEWKLIANILQDSRMFADDVEMLHMYSKHADIREVYSVLQGMKILAEKLMEDIEGSKGRFADATTESPYRDNDWNSYDDWNDRTLAGEFLPAETHVGPPVITLKMATAMIIGKLAIMHEFWRSQMAIIDHILANDLSNQVSLTLEEANDLADDWQGYERSIADAINGIHLVSDMVVVAPRIGSGAEQGWLHRPNWSIFSSSEKDMDYPQVAGGPFWRRFWSSSTASE